MKIDRIYSGPATLLLDGRVLISGGFVRATCTGCGGVNTSSSELYDPKTGKFSLTGSMAIARNGHSATRLADGRVLVAGGADANSSDADGASAELYDPATGRFSRTGSMATRRAYQTATLLPDGDVLIAGGEDVNGPLASAELYHPATGTFSATGSLTDPREHATATLLSNGRVLIVGGARGLIGGQWDQLASAEIYDPATGRFSPTESLGTARVLQSATLLSDGRVLVAGGEGASTGQLSSAELFDPASGTFAATGSMTANRSLQPAVLLGDGRVLLVDGTDSPSAEMYDPATGKFSAIAPPLDDYMETATLLQDGRVLLTAGGKAELYVS